MLTSHRPISTLKVVEISLQDCTGERQPEKKKKKKPPEGIQLMMLKFLGMKDDQWEDTKVLEESEKYTGAYNIH